MHTKKYLTLSNPEQIGSKKMREEGNEQLLKKWDKNEQEFSKKYKKIRQKKRKLTGKKCLKIIIIIIMEK